MSGITRIHLDPVGGIAGDMFAAAMADAFPALVPGLGVELAKLGGGEARFAPHEDQGLHGQRFVVDPSDIEAHRVPDHGDGHAHGHLHVPHRDIRARLRKARLEEGVLRHALGLFALLARVEGEVHGVSPDDVAFHEVGAWDSIVDFVAAAYFIARLEPARWSCGALPLGGGRVESAHGVLPVPAPATTRLLQGLAVIDDGVQGERVTPTGAAIVRYLADHFPADAADRTPRLLAGAGHGFGTMKLPGRANVLRSLLFTETPVPGGALDEPIALLQFEVDDQTAEDLAVALDRLREMPGVLDACQVAVYGKKGRLGTQVQVLAREEQADEAADACLVQTTTLGVRISRLHRRRVPRDERDVGDVRVKVAQRPDGTVTGKAEMDDLARIPGDRAQRESARRRAEETALGAKNGDGPRRKRD